MSKAKSLVQRAKEEGRAEGKSEAADAIRLAKQQQKPTIVHVEPKVDVDVDLKALEPVLPLLRQLAGKESPELDVSSVAEAIQESKLDLGLLVKAVTGVADAVAEQSAVLGRLQEFEAGQRATTAALEAVTKEISRMAEAQEALTKAYRAKRTLRFTDGGAVLEAK